MVKNTSKNKADTAEFRRVAEAKLSERRKKTGPLPASDVDLRRLVHELEVHQIELEMQNEELKQARAETEAALDQYTELYDFAPVGYFTLARNGTIIQVNLAGASLLGLERGSVLKRRFGQFVAEKFRSIFIDFLDKMFECGKQEMLEIEIERYEQEPRCVHIEASCYKGTDECHVVVVDITAHKQAEEVLRESEKRFSNIFKHSPAAISLRTFDDGRLVDVNEAYLRLSGYSRHELTNTSLVDIGAFNSKAEYLEFVKKLSTQRYLNNLDFPFRTKSGEPHDVLASYQVISIQEEKFLLASFQDIQDQKNAEQLLKKAQRVAKLGSWKWNIPSNRLDWSEEMYHIFGIEKENFSGELGDVIEHAIHPEDREKVNASNLSVIKENKPIPLEYRIILPDGEVRMIWAEAGELILNEKEEPIALSGIVQDITERKESEENLRKSEERYRTLFENMGEGIGLTNPQNEFLLANPAAEYFFGTKANQLVGHNVFDFISPEQQDFIHEQTRRRKIGKKDSYEIEINAADGVKRQLLVTTVPQFDSLGQFSGTFGVFRDITERKEAEQAIRQSQEQLRAVTMYWQNAIEAERAHISREIHDEFGQSMTALKMDLSWLANHLPQSDEVMLKRIQGMRGLVDDSITLMRRIATDLRPNLLDDLGLNAALEWQTGEFTRRSKVPCELKLPESELALDPALITTLFRLVQESLTNVARHAQATHTLVSLEKQAQILTLIIHDNGNGIQDDVLKHPRSLGLLSLRERAAQWGGETDIRSQIGKGTTVTVRIPLTSSLANGDN